MIGLNQGTKVGTYVLERQLGEGGQGSVWEALPEGEPSAQPVALKVIPVRGSSPVTVERLRREAQALVRLSSGHASLVGCHGIVEDAALGVMAIVMDKVEGVDLQAALREPRCTEGAKALMLTHVARALAHLHEAGVVHRDIKPQNILVTHAFFANPSDEATVKVVDFGIAIVAGNPKPLTEIGTVIGTPAYMSPERIDPLFWQARPGLPSEDVWAFGVVAYEAFFGKHPTGVGDEGLLSDYAERYRGASRTYEPWPPLPPNHPWEAPLRGALALRVADRLPSGAAVVGAVNARRVAATLSDPIPRHTAAQPPSAYAFQATPAPPPAGTQPGGVERTEVNRVLERSPGAGAAWAHSPAPPPAYYTPQGPPVYPASSPAVAVYGPPPVPQPPARRSALVPAILTGAAGLLVLGGSLMLAQFWKPTESGANGDGPAPAISASPPPLITTVPPMASAVPTLTVPPPETRTPPATPRPPTRPPPPQPSGGTIIIGGNTPPPPPPPPPPTQTPPSFPPITIPPIIVPTRPPPQQPPPPTPPTQTTPTTPPQSTPPPIGRPPPPIFTAPPPVNTAPPLPNRPPPPRVRIPGSDPTPPPTPTTNRPPPPRVRIPR